MLAGDIASHAPIADEPPFSVKPGLAAGQTVVGLAVGMLPVEGQVAQFDTAFHLGPHQIEVVVIEVQRRDVPGQLPQHRQHRHKLAGRVAPGQLAQAQVGVGLPVGAGGDAQQRPEALLAGVGGAQVLARQAGHDPAHQRTGHDGRTRQHQPHAKGRPVRRLGHPAQPLGRAQCQQAGQRQAGTGPAQPRRTHGVGQQHHQAKHHQPRRLQAPAADPAQQAHRQQRAQQQRRQQRPGTLGRQAVDRRKTQGQHGIDAHHEALVEHRQRVVTQQRKYHPHRADQRGDRTKRTQQAVLHGMVQVELDRGGRGRGRSGHG